MFRQELYRDPSERWLHRVRGLCEKADLGGKASEASQLSGTYSEEVRERTGQAVGDCEVFPAYHR